MYLHCCALYCRYTVLCIYTALHCVVEIKMIIFRAGFKTKTEEQEYLLQAPHRITSLFPPHNLHQFIPTIQFSSLRNRRTVIFFCFWHYSPFRTLAFSKIFLHCSVQVNIFFFVCGLFLQHCVSHYTASMGGKFV